MDIVKELEHYRLENRVTQEEIAKEIGVNFSTIRVNGLLIAKRLTTR